MIVFLNGQFVPEEQATISVFDRGFLYGDGLFEALRVARGKPFRWDAHMERLQRGAAFLKIVLPFTPDELLTHACGLVELNAMPQSMLRITLSRGVGKRGYSPKGADKPTLVMTLHPSPEFAPDSPPMWQVITASLKLPANDPLAGFKTANKLPQILSRAEADAAGVEDALLLNTQGHLVESTSGNLFWIDGDCVCTPPLQSGILPGVTRQVVLEICRELRIPSREENIASDELARKKGAFLSLSSLGVVEIGSLDGKGLPHSLVTSRIQRAYEELFLRETS